MFHDIEEWAEVNPIQYITSSLDMAEGDCNMFQTLELNSPADQFCVHTIDVLKDWPVPSMFLIFTVIQIL